MSESQTDQVAPREKDRVLKCDNVVKVTVPCDPPQTSLAVVIGIMNKTTADVHYLSGRAKGITASVCVEWCEFVAESVESLNSDMRIWRRALKIALSSFAAISTGNSPSNVDVMMNALYEMATEVERSGRNRTVAIRWGIVDEEEEAQ